MTNNREKTRNKNLVPAPSEEKVAAVVVINNQKEKQQSVPFSGSL